MQSQRRQALDLAREAVQWLDRLDENGAAEYPAFTEWLMASPLHVKAFLNASAVEDSLESLDPHRKIDVEKLVRERAANVSSLLPLAPVSYPEGEKRETSKPRWKLVFAAATAAIAVGMAWTLHLLWVASNTWSTEIGEQLTAELSDGSVMNLNARSDVRVRFSEQARDVFLEGEAMFKVRSDPARPFRVHSGDTIIQAVGTQFNVHRLPSGIVVSVIEGVVRVDRPSESEALQLTAGEEARVKRAGAIEKRTLSESATLAAWRQHRLIFSDDQLEDIADTFNRWNHEQIHVEGAEVAARLYSGVFDADDPESFIAFLKRDPSLDLRAQGQHVVIRPAQTPREPTHASSR